jgi:hypothetical protein
MRSMTMIRIDRVAGFLNRINPNSVRGAGNVSSADLLEGKRNEWDIAYTCSSKTEQIFRRFDPLRPNITHRSLTTHDSNPPLLPCLLSHGLLLGWEHGPAKRLFFILGKRETMVMQRATHPSPIGIVRDHIEAWRRDNRWSRETVADLIVQAHIRIGGPVFSGITFEPPTTDTFERMRVNADRVFRWLDDHTKDKNLLPFNFVLSIVAALPEDRRVMLLNDLLAPLALHVEAGMDDDGDVSHEEIVEAFQSIVDHSAAATIATSQLLDGVQSGEAEQADKKLGLMASTVKKARGLMGRLIKRRK